MRGSTQKDSAMGNAVVAYLRRHGALAMQTHCAAAAECSALLPAVLAETGARRLVLMMPEGLDLPEPFAGLAIVRLAPGPAIGVAEFAAALDSLPQIEAAVLVLLCGTGPVALPPDLVPVAPQTGLGPWLAARLRDAACGDRHAG